MSTEAGKGGQNLIEPWMLWVDLVLLDVVFQTMEGCSRPNVDEYVRKSNVWSRRQKTERRHLNTARSTSRLSGKEEGKFNNCIHFLEMQLRPF